MIRLHHCHQTRSMRVLWLLNELDIPFEVVDHPFDKSLRSADYLAVHPVGRVPSLELDGEVIWESGAIMEVLCERFPEAGMGRLPGDPERTDWLIWLHFAETVSQHTANLTQQHVMLYEDWMRSPTVMKLEAKRLTKCYAAIEARLTPPEGARDYLLSRGFSATDIAVGQMGTATFRFDNPDDAAGSRILGLLDRPRNRHGYLLSAQQLSSRRAARAGKIPLRQRNGDPGSSGRIR